MRFDTRVLGFDELPRRGDTVVDLEGAVVLPGLINAHDHLELNHYGPLKRRESYVNACDWIEDLRPVIRTDGRILEGRRHPLHARLFIGGLKNLLAGATTVAHHNPLYRGAGRAVPVRLVRRFGWAHSLAMQNEPVGAGGERGGDVRARFVATPPDRPFIVHASEGTDARAAAELSRLEATGCVGANTVLVHGVAWTDDDWRRVVTAGAGLVWCPVSNAFLFGRTARVADFLALDPASVDAIALGSDSRLTGARDLLEELNAAAERVAPEALVRMVTGSAARLLRLSDAGDLRPGKPADFIVVPPRGSDSASSLVGLDRRGVRLVVINGRPMVGRPEFRRIFTARATQPAMASIDGEERLVPAALATAIATCPISEPGVTPGVMGTVP
jgi:hypothetical protein